MNADFGIPVLVTILRQAAELWGRSAGLGKSCLLGYILRCRDRAMGLGLQDLVEIQEQTGPNNDDRSSGGRQD